MLLIALRLASYKVIVVFPAKWKIAMSNKRTCNKHTIGLADGVAFVYICLIKIHSNTPRIKETKCKQEKNEGKKKPTNLVFLIPECQISGARIFREGHNVICSTHGINNLLNKRISL